MQFIQTQFVIQIQVGFSDYYHEKLLYKHHNEDEEKIKSSASVEQFLAFF
jgi:hypothetical protein